MNYVTKAFVSTLFQSISRLLQRSSS